MPILPPSTGTGSGGSDLPTTIINERHAVSDGTNLVESDLQETNTQISTNKDFFAKTLTAAQASIEIGPALTLSAGGGELLQRSLLTDTGEIQSILPRKRYDNIRGTEGEFTNGRLLGPQQTITLFSGDSLRSDDVTAIVPPNNISGKVTYTIVPTENRFITHYFMRYATVQTGVRQVWRVGSDIGPVVFESEPDRSFQDGIGTTTLAYDGTPSTETGFDFINEPLVLLSGEIYYVTLESSVGPVVTFGGLELGEYKPYSRREVQDLFSDPVVAMGSASVTSDFTYNGFGFWYTNLFVDASSGDVEITLNTAVGPDSKSLQGYIYKTDSSPNKVTITPFGSETIDGEANYVLTEENEVVGLMSDGVDIHINSKTMTDAVLNSDISTAAMQFVIDEGSMVSNSPTKVPTQQSVKTYVDNAVTANLQYKGGYNAATNTPNLETDPTGVITGWFYTVTVAGTFFSTPVSVGDALIAEADNPTVEGDWTILNRGLDAATIKMLYESNPDTNVFDDAAETKLGGIEPLAEVNNIDDIAALSLTSVADTILHFHNSDRDRANHTGTQLAATISDFDSKVASNLVVDANTAKTSWEGATTDISLEGDGKVTPLSLSTLITGAINDNTDKRTYPQADEDKLALIEPLAEVNNISDVDAADLTDGGETTLHNHPLPINPHMSGYLSTNLLYNISMEEKVIPLDVTSHGTGITLVNGEFTVGSTGEWRSNLTLQIKETSDPTFAVFLEVKPLATGVWELANGGEDKCNISKLKTDGNWTMLFTDTLDLLIGDKFRFVGMQVSGGSDKVELKAASLSVTNGTITQHSAYIDVVKVSNG